MIRKVYQDIIIRKTREEGPGWLFRRGRQYLLLQLSSLLNRPLCGPALGTLMVTYRCNFHCAMCDLPLVTPLKLREGLDEFDTDRFKGIIKQFAGLGAPGIGFTGGEPLLRPDIFELLAYTRKQGMIAHLNTNGWLLGAEEAERIVDIGVDSVNISLDGATQSTHDRFRRCAGAFERAVTAFELLVKEKKRRGSHVRVKTVAVIDETNIDEVPGMIALCGTLGTDCIEFIPRQPFVNSSQRAVPDAELLAKVDKLVTFLQGSDYGKVRIENSPAHLRLFPDSFAGLPTPVRCSAGYNSLVVDCYGDIFPCVPWINWGKSCANVSNSSLKEIWRSSEYQAQRGNISTCRSCYLNCQTELNLLFDLATRSQLLSRKS